MNPSPERLRSPAWRRVARDVLRAALWPALLLSACATERTARFATDPMPSGTKALAPLAWRKPGLDQVIELQAPPAPDPDPSAGSPIRPAPPGLDQTEQAITQFQRARRILGPEHQQAWVPFLHTILAYLDQPSMELQRSPLIRARIAAEYELDLDRQRDNPVPAELERLVAVLLGRIDRHLAALPGSGRRSVRLSLVERSEGTIGWPLPCGVITSRFGFRKDPFQRNQRRFHAGVDLASIPNDPVYAAKDGVVILAESRQGAGLSVRLRHNEHEETLYAHLSRILVTEGQRIRRGDVIGQLGMTGRATGHHLHFAYYQDGQAVDPLPHLPSIPMAFSDSFSVAAFGFGDPDD